MRTLLLIAALAGCSRGQAEPEGPRGSHIVCGWEDIYFEHEIEDGGWERIGVVEAPPISAAAKGTWYFPVDAGHMRIRVQSK